MPAKLYSYWRSSSAYRVRIALNIKGIEHEIVPISLVKDGGEHRKDEYRARNPQMLVPFFEDGNVAIGQSMAIIEYLEETYEGRALLPDDRALRARVRAFCNLIACDVQPLNNLRVMSYLKSDMGVDDDAVSAWYAHWIDEAFSAAEQLVDPQGPYCFGESVSMADVYLVPQVYNARRFNVPLDAYPKLVAITDACNELQAFMDAAPESQSDADL
jgi:maleylacetoacetate isomerase